MPPTTPGQTTSTNARLKPRKRGKKHRKSGGNKQQTPMPQQDSTDGSKSGKKKTKKRTVPLMHHGVTPVKNGNLFGDGRAPNKTKMLNTRGVFDSDKLNSFVASQESHGAPNSWQTSVSNGFGVPSELHSVAKATSSGNPFLVPEEGSTAKNGASSTSKLEGRFGSGASEIGFGVSPVAPVPVGAFSPQTSQRTTHVNEAKQNEEIKSEKCAPKLLEEGGADSRVSGGSVASTPSFNRDASRTSSMSSTLPGIVHPSGIVIMEAADFLDTKGDGADVSGQLTSAEASMDQFWASTRLNENASRIAELYSYVVTHSVRFFFFFFFFSVCICFHLLVVVICKINESLT